MPYVAIDPTTAAAAPVTTIGNPLVSQGETLATLRAELQLQIIRTGTGADDARYNKWINLAYRHVAAMVTLNEMMGSLAITTAASQPLYLLPQSVAWIKQIPLSDPSLFPYSGGRNMGMIDLAGYRELPDVPAWGNSFGPYKYFRFGRVLVLWPTPMAVKTVIIDFRVRPNDLTLDTHSPLLPQEWHEPILLRARYVAFRSLQMFDKSAIAQNDFVSCIRELINTDSEEIKGKDASFSPARLLRAAYRGGNTRYRDGELPEWAR